MGAWISRESVRALTAGRMRMPSWWETLTEGPAARAYKEDIARIDAQIRQVSSDASLDPIIKDNSLSALRNWRQYAVEDLARATREGS